MSLLDFFILPVEAAETEPSVFTSIVPLAILFLVFYFLLIRPQQKRAKAHKKLISEIKIGDEVTTSGGLCGVITEVTESFIGLKITKDVEVLQSRANIAQVLPTGTLAFGTPTEPKRKPKAKTSSKVSTSKKTSNK